MMKKLFTNDFVIFTMMGLSCAANILSIYLPKMIGGAIAIIVTLLAFLSLMFDVGSKRRMIVQIILFVLMLGTSFASMKTISINNHQEQVRHEKVQKERADKRLKQEIDSEVSKQLDQRMAEIKNNRK